MSRIGKNPIPVPNGVEVKINDNQVTVKGPKGEQSHTIPSKLISVEMKDNQIIVTRQNDSRSARSLHGLNRTLIANMIEGVTKGFSKKLEINGVGYRCQVSGKTLKLELGFSHPIDFPIPEGIEITQDQKNKNLIEISGADKQTVGQVCAEIRAYRPPEPYKGKGIKYIDEQITRKAGKTAAAA